MFTKLLLKNKQEIAKIKLKVRNCETRNLDTISAELYKRLMMPIYLPANTNFIILIIQSKEKIIIQDIRQLSF